VQQEQHLLSPERWGKYCQPDFDPTQMTFLCMQYVKGIQNVTWGNTLTPQQW
jgi:hypothetical protein